MKAPVEESKGLEELYKKCPKGPSLREIWAGWANVGGFESLWLRLIDCPWDMINQEDIFRLGIQALEVKSRDPEQFAADVFGRMTVFVSSLPLRSQLFLGKYIEQCGRA